MSIPTLFSPITLAGRVLPNRIGFAALSTRFPEPGRVGERMITHLAARLLADPNLRGQRAMLLDLDATPATYDLATLLAERFESLLLVTPRDAIAHDTPLLVAQGMLKRLAAARVALLTCRDGISDAPMPAS